MSDQAKRIVERFKQAGGYVIGPRGLETPGGKGVTLQEGAAYWMGASSSPQMIALTKVTDDTLKYKAYPFNGGERQIQRWIGADLIEKGTKMHLKTYGRHMDPGLKRSLESLLQGGKGRKEKLDDYKPVQILAKPAAEFEGQDLWRAAEEYGGVGGVEIDDVMHYEIDGSKKQAEKMKSDRRFEIVKVTDR